MSLAHARLGPPPTTRGRSPRPDSRPARRTVPSTVRGGTVGRAGGATSDASSTSSSSTPPPSHAYDALVFDLDGVLYPADNGYMSHVRDNARRYIASRFDLSDDDAESLRREAFALANQTVKGLRMLGREVDPDDFADFCRSGEERFLHPDDDVITCVSALSARYGGVALGDNAGRAPGPASPPGEPRRREHRRMLLMTNASEKRAKIALRCLGLDGMFHRVYGAAFMSPRAKPDEEAFRAVLSDAGVDPRRAVMFEDSLKNLKAAKRVGMRTVFVSGETAAAEGATGDDIKAVADAVVPALRLADLVRAAPDLWR